VKKSLLLLVTLCASCAYTSVPPERSSASRETRGAQGLVVLRDGVRIDGELLQVGDSALTVLAPTRLMVVPFGDVSRTEFAAFRSSLLSSRPARSTMEEGRRASRFPLGMPSAALEAILRSIGQPSPDTIRAVRR
jgi:hypothetical protein